ncbi:hypothetical protein [Erwinia sp. MYb416]|uniref:hypothetical protein n=1 Tax=Erwinia sp. MYb416 TaxID=3108532 RepID=UPI00309BF292
MRGLFFRNLSRALSAEIRSKLKKNSEHRDLRWNRFERAIAWCSTHYVQAMVLLWGAAISALVVALCFRSPFKHFAASYLKGIKDLPAWQSGLLGGQLTIIGIVFPLVVGLISVIFQKKSTREHIQAAYQLYSGYMFSGLSGLSLSAFILIGGLLSAIGDSYLNKAFSVVAFFWMTLNIALSVWFFIQSLNVLDDGKRSRIMLKYFHSRAVMQYVENSFRGKWLIYPGDEVRDLKVDGVEIMPYATGLDEKEYDLISIKLKDGEMISDIYTWPLKFLLKMLKPSGCGDAYLYLMPSGSIKNEHITILASQNVYYSYPWAFFFRFCFRKKKKVEPIRYSAFTSEFFGEVYDALEDKNLGAFEGAVDRLSITYTRLKRSFRYDNGNYLDECSGGGWLHTFSRSFHYDLVRLGWEAVKTTETTSLYFSRILRVPWLLFDRSFEETADVSLSIETEVELWDCLIGWKKGAASELTVSQEQRHREMIAAFIGSHESWMMSLRIQRKKGLTLRTYRKCLITHLLCAPHIILSAVSSDDTFATDHATDHLNLWFSQSQQKRDWQAEHHWHSVLMTPNLLDSQATDDSWANLLDGHSYDEEAAMAVAYRNAVTDLRLLTAGYIIAHLKPGKNVRLTDVAMRLLNNSIVYPAGSHDAMTHNIRSMSDVIDIILRLESGNYGNQGSWYDTLSELTERLSGRKEQFTIPGRVYSGVYFDLRSLYPYFAELALTLSPETSTLSHSILRAAEAASFSSGASTQLLYQLTRLKMDASVAYSGYLIDPSEYPPRATAFNEIIDAYVNEINSIIRKKITETLVSSSRLRAVDNELTSAWGSVMQSDAILSLFEIYHNASLYNSGFTLKGRVNINKEMLMGDTENNVNFLMPVEVIKRSFINHVIDEMKKDVVENLYELNNVSDVIRQVGELASDGQEYILILSGELYGDGMQQLKMDAIRPPALNQTPVSDNFSLYPVKNCIVYAASREGPDFAMLVRRDYFSRLGIYRYPDGTIFTTLWIESNGDRLTGQLMSVSDVRVDFTGNVIARFSPA